VLARCTTWIACSLALLGTTCLVGCDVDALPGEGSLADSPPPETSLFDPSAAGLIEGQVCWQGEVPAVREYRAPVSPLSEQVGGARSTWPNPHVPVIDPATRGLDGAVVFLRGIEPRRARPWDHPPVLVVLRDYQIHVCQGDSDGRVGFVRRGEVVTMESRHKGFQSLQARGADFFARVFPEHGSPCTRRLDCPGIVELSSGAGHFWMRGHLFVVDHPYYARTDRQGRFRLPQVPPGRYELVCWLPDWHEAERELDADTALICRLTFRPPLELSSPVEVRSGESCSVALFIAASDCEREAGPRPSAP
jgi:hypothetical protein